MDFLKSNYKGVLLCLCIAFAAAASTWDSMWGLASVITTIAVSAGAEFSFLMATMI